MNAAPSTPFKWTIPVGTSGLAGTLEVQIDDGTDNLVYGPSSDDIIELGASGTYVATITAPAAAGQYVLMASEDGSFDENTIAEELTVSFSSSGSVAPSGRDLCTLADVTGYVPAYDPGETTDAKLAQLITAESEQFMADSGREIVTSGDTAPRVFDIDRAAAYTGRVFLDDLAALDDDTVIALHDQTGALVEIVDVAVVVPLYGADRHPTDPWQPITGLEFRTSRGAPNLYPCWELRITGSWGFPSIPAFVAEGVAAAVVLRSLSDVAITGTDFAEAADTVNFGGLARRRDDALAGVSRLVIA